MTVARASPAVGVLPGSAQANDFTVDVVYMVGLRVLGQAGHTQDVAGDGYDHFGAGVDDYVAHEEVKPADSAVLLGVGREGVLCFGDAHREMSQTECLDLLDAALGRGGERHAGGAV